MYRSMKNDESVQSDLSFWRGGQFQHNNILWLQSAAELNRSNHLIDFPPGLRPTSSFSSAKKKLEAEWEMCRREYDARIALMMLTDQGHPTSSPTPTVESRAPVQLMKLLDDRSSDSAGARRTDGWHFILGDPKRPQELQENQGGKVYPLPITSRPLLDTTSASHANIYNRFQAGNVMDELGHEFYKSTGSHQLVKRPTMPELTAVQRYNYERDFAEQKWGRSSREVNHSPSELDNSTLSGLSSSRPHSWPGSCNTMPISQSLGLSGPRYSSTTDMETEPGHVHLVDFLSLPQSSRGVLHGHMGSGPADGLQLDLTMSTGPAAHVDESLSSLPPKNVELDLTLDLSMSSR